MANENEYSAEHFVSLAASDPAAWVKCFLDENGLDASNAEEFNNANEFHGFTLVEVYDEGGTEGGGEHCEKVFAIAPAHSKVVNGRVDKAQAYVAFYGCYYSYDGTTWDDEAHVVEPKDVVVVQYHSK